MKKTCSLLLALVLCLSLCAHGEGKAPTTPTESEQNYKTMIQALLTGKKAETAEKENAIPIEIGDCIDNDNFKMTFESIDILSEYSYQAGENYSTSLYVEKGYKLLLVKGHFENKSTHKINKAMFNFSAVVNGECTIDGFDVSMNFQRGTYFEIDPYTDVDYCLYVSIPNKLADMYETAEFYINFKSDMSPVTTTYYLNGTSTSDADNHYVLSASGCSSATAETTETKKATTIVLGKTISTDDFDFTVNNVELTYELKPKNTSSVYSSYPAEDNKVYIHVDGEYFNKSKRDICIRDLFAPTADYDKGYTYTGFVVTDRGDNDFDWVDSHVVCTPLDTCHYHGLIECPKVIDKSDAPLVVYFNIQGTTYQYIMR